ARRRRRAHPGRGGDTVRHAGLGRRAGGPTSGGGPPRRRRQARPPGSGPRRGHPVPAVPGRDPRPTRECVTPPPPGTPTRSRTITPHQGHHPCVSTHVSRSPRPPRSPSLSVPRPAPPTTPPTRQTPPP